MKSPEEPRTKTSAFKMLINKIDEIIKVTGETEIRSILSEDLIKKIFDLAWLHQFDHDRKEFLRKATEAVQLSIDVHQTGGKE